jgi:uncharacterized protein (TIGR02246 family)
MRTLPWSAIVVVAALIGLSAPRHARGGATADSASIGAIVADLDSSWAHADAALWASYYTADAEFINILGMLMPDVKSMQARHHEIFQGVFRGSRHLGTLRRVRFLGPDAAIADVDVEVTGFKALPPGSVPTAPGVLRTRMRHIFARVGGTWKIVASQNTAVAPKP